MQWINGEMKILCKKFNFTYFTLRLFLLKNERYTLIHFQKNINFETKVRRYFIKYHCSFNGYNKGRFQAANELFPNMRLY